MVKAMAAVVGVTVMLLVMMTTAPAQDAASTAEIARNLAENILGKGQVRASRVTNGGRSLQMVWESATFKPANTPQHSRELLKVEAEFASAAVFRVLNGVREMDFEITLGKRSLCSGAASRERPMRMSCVRDLGG